MSSLADARQRSTQNERSLLAILQQPGTRRVYVHDYSDLAVPTLDKTMGWLSDYRAERAIVMAQKGDAVVVNQPVDSDYLRYLDDLDVGPGFDGVLAIGSGQSPSRSLLDDLCAREDHTSWLAHRLEDAEHPRINVFYSGERTERFRLSLETRLHRQVGLDGCSADNARIANRKDLLRNAAISLGVPVAPGEVVMLEGAEAPEAMEQAVFRQRVSTGGVIIRAAWSGGGLDNYLIRQGERAEDFKPWLSERAHLQSYLVDSLLTFDTSPNVQAWIDDDGCSSIQRTTNQRLDDSLTHVGNSHPYQHGCLAEMEVSARTLCDWLSGQGYRGPLGIDFLAAPQEKDSSHCFVEVNGRINGATYMIALFERINQIRIALGREPFASWVSSKKIQTRARRFRNLSEEIGDLLYGHDSSAGVVPYNSGLLNIGIASFLIFADTITDAERIEADLSERLTSA